MGTRQGHPPPRVTQRDTVVGLGYPGQHQKVDGAAIAAEGGRPVVDVRPIVSAVTVSSSSTQHFVLVENDDDDACRGVVFNASLEELRSPSDLSLVR